MRELNVTLLAARMQQECIKNAIRLPSAISITTRSTSRVMVNNNHKENEKIQWKNIEGRSKTQGNLITNEFASEIEPLSKSENGRFQRGCDIADDKNRVIELDRSQYRVKSQSNCGEYEVISTELGWTCSCADHRFRNVVCKHIFAIFSILNREQKAEPIAVNQELLTEEVNQNLPSSYNMADYEQELYEKDRYIEGLENKMPGLMGLTHRLREEIL